MKIINYLGISLLALAVPVAVQAAYYDVKTGRGQVSKGELMAAFNLSQAEVEVALTSQFRGYVYENIVYRYPCQWTTSSGDVMTKYYDSHLEYKSELGTYAITAGRDYRGIGFSGGTGNIEFIRQDPQPLIGSACIALMAPETDDPAELNATFVDPGVLELLRDSELHIEYQGVTVVFDNNAIHSTARY